MLLDLFNYRLDTHLAALFWNYAEYLVWTVRMGFGVYKHSNRRQILPARSTIWGFVSHLFRVKYWINEEKKIFFFKLVLTKQIIFICCAIDIVYPVFSISKRVEGLLRKPLNFLNFAVTEHAVGSTAFVLVSRLTGRFWIADISFNSRVIVFECMLFQCSWRAMTQREIMPETRTGQVAWQRISMITKGFFFISMTMRLITQPFQFASFVPEIDDCSLPASILSRPDSVQFFLFPKLKSALIWHYWLNRKEQEPIICMLNN